MEVVDRIDIYEVKHSNEIEKTFIREEGEVRWDEDPTSSYNKRRKELQKVRMKGDDQWLEM